MQHAFSSSRLLQHRRRQNTPLHTPHQLVGLLSQTQGQDSVRQNPGQMRQETLVDSEQSLGAHRLGQAVKDALVQIAVLVVQTRHDGVCENSSGSAADIREVVGQRSAYLADA